MITIETFWSIVAGAASICIWCSTGPQAYQTIKTKLTRDLNYKMTKWCVSGLFLWTLYAVGTHQIVFAIGDGVDCTMWGIVLYYKWKNIKLGVDT